MSFLFHLGHKRGKVPSVPLLPQIDTMVPRVPGAIGSRFQGFPFPLGQTQGKAPRIPFPRQIDTMVPRVPAVTGSLGTACATGTAFPFLGVAASISSSAETGSKHWCRDDVIL